MLEEIVSNNCSKLDNYTCVLRLTNLIFIDFNGFFQITSLKRFISPFNVRYLNLSC